jgi:uncharacterized protein YndB with AHSA1/START domain
MKRLGIVCLLSLVTLLLILAASPAASPAPSPVEDQADQLARSGKVQENAHVKASIEITINAPPERIWGLLTDLKNWPKWHRDITSVEISGPLESGTTFWWTTGGAAIHSRLVLVQPREQFGWTGRAYGAKAIHLWKLKPLPDGRTLVRTEESMSGFLLTLFYSSKKLEETDQRWVNDLKAAAERLD